MTRYFDDPVAAYERLGPQYAEVSRRREVYLRAVESLILRRLPTGCCSLLDVGGGDGSRTADIARQAGMRRVVIAEPAVRLVRKLPTDIEVWPIRAEDLDPDSTAERFDVITCLWNVLGHIRTAQLRVQALRAVSRLLSPHGRFFVDINHRYDLRHGMLPTCVRWLRDLGMPNEKNGDAVASWSVGDESVSTYGHVFTHGEVMALAAAGELEIQERIVVDYETGRTHRLAWRGNLLYVYRRSSRMDSSSASQTS